MEKLPKNLTWEKAREDDSIQTFEHPLTEMTMSKEQFAETFGPVLEQLNGEDMASYVDFFFEKSPMDLGHLKYNDEDAKQDFLEWAIEEECMPSVKEVQQGEDKKDKEERMEKEKEEIEKRKREEENKQKQKELNAQKQEELKSFTDKNEAKKLNKKWENLRTLKAKPNCKVEKVHRAEETIKESYNTFKENFPNSLQLLERPLVQFLDPEEDFEESFKEIHVGEKSRETAEEQTADRPTES